MAPSRTGAVRRPSRHLLSSWLQQPRQHMQLRLHALAGLPETTPKHPGGLDLGEFLDGGGAAACCWAQQKGGGRTLCPLGGARACGGPTPAVASAVFGIYVTRIRKDLLQPANPVHAPCSSKAMGHFLRPARLRRLALQLYWINPLAYTLYALIANQLGNVNTPLAPNQPQIPNVCGWWLPLRRR